MKPLLLSALLLASAASFAQEATNEKTQELNCYNKWAARFEERGADPVADGIYEDVIITNRQGAKAVCHQGRAEVRNGVIVKFSLLLTDGTYEEFKRAWRNNSNQNVTVINGISTSMQSVQGELVNVIWPSKIRPKKASPVVAAEPVEE